MSLLTGRGYAFRIVEASVSAGTAIRRMGVIVPLSALKPGAVVRVEFEAEPVRGVRKARSVEVQEVGR